MNLVTIVSALPAPRPYDWPCSFWQIAEISPSGSAFIVTWLVLPQWIVDVQTRWAAEDAFKAGEGP